MTSMSFAPGTNPTTNCSWSNPQRIGAGWQWYDATNKVFRQKPQGSAPTSETDGSIIPEA